nr:FxsA family protein [Bacillus ectoiniformans]
MLLLSGKTIGIVPTIMLILTTGFIGAYLAKKQGLHTIRRLQTDLQQGLFIGDSVLDGVCILVGGLLLLTPGFITDATGFFLLVPQTRHYLKPALYKLFRRWFQNGNIIIMK